MDLPPNKPSPWGWAGRQVGTRLFCTLTFLSQPGMRGSWKVKTFVAQPCLTLWSHGLWPTRLPCPRDSSLGKNTRVDSRSLLQGIFLTQGLNLGLLHCWQIPYHLRMESQVCEINVWAWPTSASLSTVLFFIEDFVMWTIFKVFIEFVTVLLLFMFWIFWPRGMWNLSFLTRDWTCFLCTEVLTTGLPEKSLLFLWLPW